jgi:hypothetical protein
VVKWHRIATPKDLRGWGWKNYIYLENISQQSNYVMSLQSRSCGKGFLYRNTLLHKIPSIRLEKKGRVY